MSPNTRNASFLLILTCIIASIKAAPTIFTPNSPHAVRQTSSNTTSFQTQNGLDAQKLNAQFANMTVNDPCEEGTNSCIPFNGTTSFAECVSGTWQLIPCDGNTACFALPLVNKPGTTLACDFESDLLSRLTDAGVSGGPTGQDSSTGVSDDGNNTDDGSADCDDGDDSSSSIVPSTIAPNDAAAATATFQTSAGSVASNTESFTPTTTITIAEAPGFTQTPVSLTGSAASSFITATPLLSSSTASFTPNGVVITLNRRQISTTSFFVDTNFGQPTTTVSSSASTIPAIPAITSVAGAADPPLVVNGVSSVPASTSTQSANLVTVTVQSIVIVTETATTTVTLSPQSASIGAAPSEIPLTTLTTTDPIFGTTTVTLPISATVLASSTSSALLSAFTTSLATAAAAPVINLNPPATINSLSTLTTSSTAVSTLLATSTTSTISDPFAFSFSSQPTPAPSPNTAAIINPSEFASLLTATIPSGQ